ncbi:ATP synthase alpha chain [Lacticaseibacillus paracasei]|nr:ATP synthase alpha chain [Lacticaseibacillus paracasei]
MSIKTEEISSLIKKQLEGYQDDLAAEEVGTVTYIGDGIARATGLEMPWPTNCSNLATAHTGWR